MVTVYGARSVGREDDRRRAADARPGHRRHPGRAAYRANDVALLDWVQATASFGFMEAYHAYARPLSAADRDRFYAEAAPAAALYGAVGAPASVAEWEAQLAAMLPGLERHEIVFEFLDLMRRTAILPAPLRGLQGALIRAAVAITPANDDEADMHADIPDDPEELQAALVARFTRFAELLELKRQADQGDGGGDGGAGEGRPAAPA
jgi:uncharacterized protein (DUF2236 family)